MSESGDSDLASDWQHVMAEWESASIEHSNASARYRLPGISELERAELTVVLAELATRMQHLKHAIDQVIKVGQAGRSASGNEFVAATLRTNELSESPDTYNPRWTGTRIAVHSIKGN